QILCGVRDPRDPAVTVVQRLRHDFPERDIALVVGPEVIGTNYKVSTLHHLAREAKYDVFVISDSDVWVEPDYLRALIPPLADPPPRGSAWSPARTAAGRPRHSRRCSNPC